MEIYRASYDLFLFLSSGKPIAFICDRWIISDGHQLICGFMVDGRGPATYQWIHLLSIQIWLDCLRITPCVKARFPLGSDRNSDSGKS